MNKKKSDKQIEEINNIILNSDIKYLKAEKITNINGSQSTVLTYYNLD